MAISRQDVRFSAGDASCAAWLYRPERSGPVPIVVLGHGLGAVREMRLDAYAERFVQAGLAALVFDYRHFGASGGTPRQLLDIDRQLADWAAAIAYARTLPDIDPARVALFGTSFGGGHAIVAAARDGKVHAVVAQCPFTDGLASALAVPPLTSIRLTGLGIADVARSAFGASPAYVPLAAAPGEVALMTAHDAQGGLRQLQPPGSNISNQAAARIALRIPFYFPGRELKHVKAKVLVCVCDDDTVAPARATLRWAASAPNVEVVRFPIGHFEIYFGEAFERAVTTQTEFLTRVLHPEVGRLGV